MARTWVSRLWPAALFQFCFIGAVSMMKPGATALMLARFQEGALPWLYMAAALVTGTLAVLRLGKNSDPGFVAFASGLAALTLAVGLWFNLPFFRLGAYLFAEAFATLVSLAFWNALTDAFDAREARRAFTWVNGIGMSGAIVGGFSAQLLSRYVGALGPLVAGGGLLVVGAFAWRFHRSDVEPPAQKADAPRTPLKQVVLSPYTRLIAGLVLGFAVLQQFTDFAFNARAVAQLSEAEMADLFAAHQLWTGVACALFQFVLAEALLRRLGVVRYAGLAPAGLAVLTVVAWAVPSVWSAWALKVFEGAVSWALMPVAVQLLYAPLPDASRDGARRTIDGFLKKGGMGVAGVLLLGIARAVGVQGVFALLLLGCVGLVVALVRLKPRYVEAVHERVAGVLPGDVRDAEERVLVEALKAPSSERALRAAELLELAGLVREAHVRLMLAHPGERLQEKGVALALSLQLTGLSKALEALVAQGARRPRDAAIWALAKLNPERARAVLGPLLFASDPGVLAAAVGGVLSLPGEADPAARAALTRLLERGGSAPVAERREVARLLGRLQGAEHGHALQRYLDDGDPTVRRVAITSVGAGRYFELAPKLLRFLTWRDDRRVAREALAALGDEVVPLLAATLDDRTRALSLRLQLPRVLRLTGTQAALDALLFSNAQDDPSLHYRIGIALAQLKEEHPELRVDPDRRLAALTRRKEVYERLVTPYRDARAAFGDEALLTRVLGDRLDQALELAFWLLGLTHDERTLRRAHFHLVGADSRRRAWALEYVDNALPREEWALVSQQVEAHHRSLPHGAAARFPEHLGELCQRDDLVLRACARAVARRIGVWTNDRRGDDMNDGTLKKLFALEGVEIFAQSDVDDLAAVAALAKEASFKAGERIFSEGDPGDALYVIVEGAVSAVREGEVVLTFRARESFGETSLMDGTPRINDAVATVDTKVLVIDRRDFLDLLADRPELLTGMFRMVSRQLKAVVASSVRRTTGEFQLGPPVPSPPVPTKSS
ncbi:MAG: cyclic nucleotide-binding domain-containing protein [Myxococcota bacterium]